MKDITDERQMWVHDKGGASDNDFGFHKFLCEFLEIDLPKVITYKGDYTQIYLQQLASSFIIEQKKDGVITLLLHQYIQYETSISE